MNNTIKTVIVSVLFFFIGFLYFASNHGWLIMRFPSYKSEIQQTQKNLRAHKKKVKLIFWHNKKWNHETVEILATNDDAQTTAHLINNWLTLLDEENIMTKKVTLQSALISQNRQLYLSFDRNPFDEQSSTYKKTKWTQGLLKTVLQSAISVQSIQFLVHHQTMNDYHLDFTNPWPINGFLT
ncbi:hypothetical protein KAH94_03415 [bacterium]|nr:hypothetical protein [bacterium]